MTDYGTPRRHFNECGSTNDLARDWALDADDPAPGGALVTADYQTKGRGRRGRDWQAEAGQSALMSFVCRPEVPPSQFGQLALVAALSVADALAAFTGLDPRIKWPNDLLLGRGKVAGVLVESFPAQAAVIVGIGVNVRQERFAGAEGFVYPPTSLRLATGREAQTEAVVRAVSGSLAAWEEAWRVAGFGAILGECRERLAVGAAVRRREEPGELWGLADDGAAVVKRADGTFVHWATVD